MKRTKNIMAHAVTAIAALTLSQLPTRTQALGFFSKCNIKCVNGGKCRIRDVDHVPYCHCPTSYTGTKCEIKFVICDKGINGTCFNDTPCIRDLDADNNEFYHCECDQSVSDLSEPYALKLCEHSSSMFCKPQNEKENSLGPTGDSYCANSGKCKPAEKGKHHPGCICAPGWSGLYCEIPDSMKGKVPTKTNVNSKTAKANAASTAKQPMGRLKRFIIAFVSFFVLFGAVAITVLLVEHGRSGTRRSRPRRPRRSRIRGGRQRVPSHDEEYVEENDEEEEDEEEEEEEEDEEDEDDDDHHHHEIEVMEQEMVPTPPRRNGGRTGAVVRSRSSGSGEFA